MSRSINIQRLLDRGRKAGLNTRELYSAMSGQSSDGTGHAGVLSTILGGTR